MASQPNHVDVFRAANDLCASTITEVENALASQRESDAAEASRLREEERQKAEMARLAAVQEEEGKLERLKKLQQDRLDIKAAEHELQMRKQALRDAEKGPDDGDNNDNDNDDDGSLSGPEGHMVRCISLLSLNPLLIMIYNSSGNHQWQDEASAG